MLPESRILPILDHVVILVSYKSLQELPEILENSLTVIEGGSHADGRTVNKLIIFSDGSYIELIAFRDGLDPERRKEHRWGSLKEGAIVDWAYTLADVKEFSAVQKRVEDANSETGFRYHDPVPGGRIRPDGVELKWAISSVLDASKAPLWPGTAPFWCLDITPRHLRVPYRGKATETAPSYTNHPSHVVGVSQIVASVPGDEFSSISKVYNGIHGPAVENGSEVKVWRWVAHAGSKQGKQQVSLSVTPRHERYISLRLVGNEDSPRSIHILPDLAFEVGE